MWLRGSRSRSKPARSHYFFSRARGDEVRTFALGPLALWSLVAGAALSLTWAGGATLYIVFHDDMLRALVARQAELQYAYEDRLAESRAELDRVASRQLLDQNSFEGKVHELLSRQAQLERRGAIVAALVDETSRDLVAAEPARARIANASPPRAPALSAIDAANPRGASDRVADPATQNPTAQAFAPAEPVAPPSLAPKPSPVEGPQEPVSALEKPAPGRDLSDELTTAAQNRNVDASARLGLIAYSLDRIERGQASALDRLDSAARRGAARMAAVVADAGLSADGLVAPPAKGGMGGPFVPVAVGADAPAFDRALAAAERDVARADHLSRLMPILPVRAPLIGDSEVSSPFGYRADPFLGRLALHAGVDLVQGYGSEVRATAAGRVIHAGPAGGYGEMVEIDHGNGLSTRYGHLSEILVEEGQEVKAGAAVGRLGSTGRSTGPHVHYEVRVGGEPVDPERFLRAGQALFAAE